MMKTLCVSLKIEIVTSVLVSSSDVYGIWREEGLAKKRMYKEEKEQRKKLITLKESKQPWYITNNYIKTLICIFLTPRHKSRHKRKEERKIRGEREREKENEYDDGDAGVHVKHV